MNKVIVCKMEEKMKGHQFKGHSEECSVEKCGAVDQRPGSFLIFFFFMYLNLTMAVVLQEYTLAHIDKPDTLAGAEKALKKHEDFVSTMEANEDKIDGALQSGRRLVDSNNMYSGKLEDKMDSIVDRSAIMVFSFKPFNLCFIPTSNPLQTSDEHLYSEHLSFFFFLKALSLFRSIFPFSSISAAAKRLSYLCTVSLTRGC